MPFEPIRLELLLVNRANDRHGELENETAAIAQLFRLRDAHMRKLAADICSEGKIHDAPLVSPEGDRFVVFDGNRRITCMKLIADPARAPTQDLQAYFRALHDSWRGEIPESITCQIEHDRDVIDAILYRRHTGSQGGVGQSDWDDRAKRNFVERTGQGGRVNVADEVESLLADAQQLPERQIPRSTLNRLLSSEVYRERVGVSVEGNRFRLTHDRPAVVRALAHIADDLANRRVVLGDLWDNQSKLAYLNRLEERGLLPQENQRLPADAGVEPRRRRAPVRRGRPPARPLGNTFIPATAPIIPWRGDQARIHLLWDELQSLELAQFPNSAAASIRILLELTMENYLGCHQLRNNDDLSRNVGTVASHLLQRNIIDQPYFDEIERIRRNDELISIRSMQRYIHSPNFAPTINELQTFWVRLGHLIVSALTH